jgi:acyl-coenzyme A thioesterase PaaI-like protein
MNLEQLRRAWRTTEPGRLVGRGHPAGDFLEAYDWVVLERRPGYLKLDAHLPDHTKNPRGQLFGGFTPTYVDFVAHVTARSEEKRELGDWLATTNMRVDYFEPVTGPRFFIQSTLVNQRGRMCFVETRFLSLDDKLLVFALTTMRRIPMTGALGDA